MNTPPLSRHQRRRQQTHKLLIQTTLQLVLERGYDAITIQDITDQADLGRGTFYLHFTDKEDVVWTAFRELFEEFERDAHQRYDRRMPQVEYYGLLNIFRHAAVHRDLYRVIFGRQGSAMLSARAQDFLASAFLYDIRTAPPPPDVDFHIPEEIEAQIVTGIITRLLFWWLETPHNYSPEQVAGYTYEAVYRKKPPEIGSSEGQDAL